MNSGNGIGPKDIPALVSGTIKLYGVCARKSLETLFKNWIILPASILSFIVFKQAVSIAIGLGLGLVGGLLVGLLHIILLTFYYNWINQTFERSKLVWRELPTFEYPLFSSIINVGFIFFIAQLLLQSSLATPSTRWLLPVINLAIFIIFNPVAEVIMQRQSEGLVSLKDAYEFIQENWIEWFVPFALLLLPWILISPSAPLAALSGTDILLPALPLIYGTQQVTISYVGFELSTLGLLIGVILANWYMIFRSFLFNELSTTTRRKRAHIGRGD